VLAGADRAFHAVGARGGRGRVEVDLGGGVRERLVEARREALDPVLLRERAQLVLAAADEHRLRPDRRTAGHRNPALLTDREDRADEVLVRPHPAGHAVHGDPDHAHTVLSGRAGGCRSFHVHGVGKRLPSGP
jgi:hypothetical protein